MCKTYNTIGSLTTLKLHLDENNIDDFKSLKEVINFQNSYTTHQQLITSHHEELIEQEKNDLNQDLPQLASEIVIQKLQAEKIQTEEIERLKEKLNISSTYSTKNIFKRLTKYVREWKYTRAIKIKEGNYDSEVYRKISYLVAFHQDKINRYQFITSQFFDAVNQSSEQQLSELNRKKVTIEGLSSFIYGALGEQKVAKTLEALSDEYYLINDFSVSFSKAIYNSHEKEYIKSIQIDHILVAPSGIFLIETKNWSEKSMGNLSLWSPVQQIKRTSFALFKLLNNELSNYHLHLDNHHWGDKKISIRNLIVFINNKPNEEFQYVKILTINELLGYINYFKPIFSNTETQSIAEYLININNYKKLTN